MLATNPHSISPPATYNFRHYYNYYKQGVTWTQYFTYFVYT